ncbi:MAG: hypothetical protein KDC35_07335 [Acidobacteria bacterium]|nr:hypothetical protein [Acidobacteriota bacterium]
MNYLRITDIKTPPFAYVANREQAMHTCSTCSMPYPDLRERLKVEIFTTEVSNWEREIKGQPLMAEHWMIGDAQLVQSLRQHLGDSFITQEVEVVSWLSRSPRALNAKQGVVDTHHVPKFFAVFPKYTLPVDQELSDKYPPIRCNECVRDIPDIPFDVALIPGLATENPMLASLADLHYEGYDYLVREDCAISLIDAYPNMILEKLESGEPSLF